MKIKTSLALPLLLASASMVLGRQTTNNNLLRGNKEPTSSEVLEEPIGGIASRLGKVPATLMEEGAHRGLAPAPKAGGGDGMTVVEDTDMKPKTKKAPKVEEDEEEDEDGASVNVGGRDDNTLDWDAEMGITKKPKGDDNEAPKTKPKVVEQIHTPKQQEQPAPKAPAQQQQAAPPKAQAPPAQAPAPKKPAPVEEEDDEDDEDDTPAVTQPKKANGGAIPNDWFVADPDGGQHPENVKGNGATFTMTVKENEEAVRINSKQTFTGGRFEVICKVS